MSDSDDDMNGSSRPARNQPPQWWIEVPDPAQFLAQPKARKWTLKAKGYCRCTICRKSENDPPKLVSLRHYSQHHRRQRVRQERPVLVNLDATTPAAAADPPAGSTSPASMDYDNQPIAQVDLETTEFPFDVEAAVLNDIPDFAEAQDPFDIEDEPMDTNCLSTLADFIEDYTECAGPVHQSLLAARPLPNRDTVDHSTIEQVIYGTNLALVGQWNLAHSAIQFNMTQQWNIFRYGLLLGRLASGSGAGLPRHAGIEDLERFMSFDAARPAVRTLRSAERHLSPDVKDLLEVHAACSYQYCQKVFYQFRSSSEFKTGAMCSQCKTVLDGEKNLGLVPFPRMRLAVALERLLNIDGVEKMIEQAEARRQADEEFDKEKFPDIKVYRQAYSGSDWSLKALDGLYTVEPQLDSSLIVRINLGIDWYQQSRGNHARTSSVGPVIGHVTNLPVKLRGSMPLSLLLAITPGPSEIRGENLHQYLLPLCLELRQARLHGLTVRTPSHPNGRRVYVVAGAICCDGPARVSIAGGPNFNRMGQFCIRCDVVKKHQYKPESHHSQPPEGFRLAHLPDDIERYGPIYSWWLFVYERMNKLLKSANGHAADTPLIAFKKFLRLGSLETLSNYKSGQRDLPAQYLAARSSQAFRAAIASVNSIEEQRDIFAWQEEHAAAESRAQVGDGADRREPSPITVKKHRMSHLTSSQVHDICNAWSKDRLARVTVKQNSVDPGSAHVLNHVADFYTHFRIGRNHFRTAGPGLCLSSRLADSDFFKYRGCFFERRSDVDVLNCIQRRTAVGLIDSVFEIAATGKDDSRVLKRFIKVYMLKPYERTDPYRFAQRLPFMNIWLWQADLSDTRIWPLVPERMDALKPVVIKPLYSMPENRRSPKVWAFKAITHT
ncbi:hypothetical protein QFC20_006786 [Naganishia adeliensis]|uniref:Uncharacterized protein n=1 Tax=Naganishia adeliensis TaxID=92952 RepID=A0ACC2V7K5_9TREE|nr:hypothetical protein QFC20_006786 [Naganishia adeliensis]